MRGGRALKNLDYRMLQRQLKSLLEGETHWLANLANTSALLFSELEDLNWVGFYLVEGPELVLGPFQGKTACGAYTAGNRRLRYSCGAQGDDRSTQCS